MVEKWLIVSELCLNLERGSIQISWTLLVLDHNVRNNTLAHLSHCRRMSRIDAVL